MLNASLRNLQTNTWVPLIYLDFSKLLFSWHLNICMSFVMPVLHNKTPARINSLMTVKKRKLSPVLYKHDQPCLWPIFTHDPTGSIFNQVHIARVLTISHQVFSKILFLFNSRQLEVDSINYEQVITCLAFHFMIDIQSD